MVSGKNESNDAWSNAHFGLWQVSPVAPTTAANLATCRPCGRTEDVNPSQSRYCNPSTPGGMNGLIGRGICELTTRPRCYELAYAAGLRFETGSPGLESSALTTRPSCLRSRISFSTALRAIRRLIIPNNSFMKPIEVREKPIQLL